MMYTWISYCVENYSCIKTLKININMPDKNASSHNIVLLQLTRWFKNDQVTGKNNCTKCIVVWENSLVVL